MNLPFCLETMRLCLLPRPYSVLSTPLPLIGVTQLEADTKGVSSWVDPALRDFMPAWWYELVEADIAKRQREDERQWTDEMNRLFGYPAAQAKLERVAAVKDEVLSRPSTKLKAGQNSLPRPRIELEAVRILRETRSSMTVAQLALVIEDATGCHVTSTEVSQALIPLAKQTLPPVVRLGRGRYIAVPLAS